MTTRGRSEEPQVLGDLVDLLDRRRPDTQHRPRPRRDLCPSTVEISPVSASFDARILDDARTQAETLRLRLPLFQCRAQLRPHLEQQHVVLGLALQRDLGLPERDQPSTTSRATRPSRSHARSSAGFAFETAL